MSALLDRLRAERGARLKTGRPADPRRENYRVRFSLSRKRTDNRMRPADFDQLDRCKSDEARRILLGVSQ